MSYSVLYTFNFKKEIKRLSKKYPSLKNEIEILITELEENPTHGISIGKNCYKIRLAIKSKGKGKSGGARVITFFKIIKTEIYLLTIYDKSKKKDISDKEIQELITEIPI
ncbi:MAG: type II toxin-antitoxin system RelE/ParE family toxin [Bacteroidales bacterium]|nr:type II toxin-antitoxin system RelE/ParE family toxin [Bacteroidales bacterium]